MYSKFENHSQVSVFVKCELVGCGNILQSALKDTVKFNVIMSALAEVVYRELRKNGTKIAEKSDAYIYDMPRNLSMVAEKSVQYGDVIEKK